MRERKIIIGIVRIRFEIMNFVVFKVWFFFFYKIFSKMIYMREKYYFLKYVDNLVDKNIFFFRVLVYWWYFILKFKVKRKIDKIKNIIIFGF